MAAKYLFLDLETTGTDPQTDRILEIAAIVVDENLHPLGNFEAVVWQAPHALSIMTPYVRKMHTDNGLLEAVVKSQRDEAYLERGMMRLLNAARADYQQVTLAGFNISFDRGFLKRYMPALESFLAYRCLDVRSVQMALEYFTGDPLVPKIAAAKPHRAMLDAQESLDAMRHMARVYFPPPPKAALCTPHPILSSLIITSPPRMHSMPLAWRSMI